MKKILKEESNSHYRYSKEGSIYVELSMTQDFFYADAVSYIGYNLGMQLNYTKNVFFVKKSSSHYKLWGNE